MTMIFINSINKVIFTALVIFVTFYSKIALSADDARVLVINDGQVHTMNATNGFIQYDSLVLRSNATLIIETSLQQVTLVANNVEIGDNTKIIAVGAHGDANFNAEMPEAVESCKKTVDGTQGLAGKNGHNGINLSLNWAINSFGSIEIDTRGGNGAQGNAGGNGSNVPQEKNCKATRGGHGGAGGDGGRGGDGGNIFFSYSQQSQGFDVANNITTLTNGGKSGIGGLGGAGGNGSQGYYASKRTLSGSKKWIAGGESGKNGANGRNGSDGNRGIVSIKLDNTLLGSTQTQPKPIVNANTGGIETFKTQGNRIKQLEDQVRELFKRVRELEAKN